MKNIQITSLILLALQTTSVYSADFLKQLVKTDSNQKFFVGIIEEKQKILNEFLHEQSELASPAFSEKINRQINEVKTLLANTESDLQKNNEDDFLIKQQLVLKESEQVLKDTQRTHDDSNSAVTETIGSLQSFIEDPQFESFKKKNKISERLYYSFDDLQSLHDHILDYEQRVTQLHDQEKSIRIEKESRKRAVANLQEEYDKRQQDIKSFADAVASNNALSNSFEQEKEIIKLEDHLYKYKKQLADMRFQEITYQLKSVNFQLFIAKSHLDLFKKQLRMVKSAIHVSEADVTLAEENLAKEQKIYFSHKDALRHDREKIVFAQKAKEKELNSLSKQLSIPLGSEIDEWTKKPKQTSDSYLGIIQIGAINSEVILYGKEKDSLDAQIALEEEKFNYKKIRTEAEKTFHQISTHGFLTEDEIAKERTEYETKKKDAEENSKLYQTKINAVTNALNHTKKVVDRLNTFQDDAEKQSDVIFKNKSKEYNGQFIPYLLQADKAIKKQIDILGKLTGIYSGIISEINSTVRLIDFISNELQASTIWYRPAYAITLEGVKNILADTKAFLNDIRIYIAKFNSTILMLHLRDFFSHPLDIIILTFMLFVLLCSFFFIKKYHDLLVRYFLVDCCNYGIFASIAGFIIGTFITFVCSFSRTILAWITLWLICAMIPDTYLAMLFYLFSIPYLLYLSHRFMKIVINMNIQYNHVLLSEDFQHRFELVFSTLIYLTIIIFFFRQAFMLSPIYLRSELSNILLAVNFIILQISLILLITKEQIMGIIPDYSDFWRWVQAHVDHYYYLILFFVVAIIIMSNPYVGFGRLVLYLLSGSVYMIVLIKILSLLHDFVKTATSMLFFTQEDAIVKERFSYAKTCFGLVIIASFVILGFIGFIGAAKIWGLDVAITDFRQWLNVPLLLEGTTHPITTMSLLKIIAFILGGIALAYALKQYVLARIFDLLLVESGVQHTVTSIIQYIVIIIAIFFAFNSVGLGSLIGNVFIALALSIGLYLKDPISDFISYFIILVQRPIKIGDYVQIDETTLGVVRKITPRSVVLRRKNSTTIIVPNSYVVSKSIENWNYVRNFIALHDIVLFVYYKEDPARVKSILHAAIEEHPNVLKNPRSIVRLMNFSEYGYEFMVRCFVSSAYTLEMWELASDVRLLISKAFKENGIEFAVPIYKVDEYGHYYHETKVNKDNKDNKTGPSIHDGPINKNTKE